MTKKILFLSLLLLVFACSPSHQQGRGGSDSGQYIPDRQYPPRPFRFSYNYKDQFGNTNFHESQGDEAGNVRGKYGYTDVYGLFRTVVYEADRINGYRATVHTNEPGVGKENPADVVMVVEPVPQAVVDRYAKSSRN